MVTRRHTLLTGTNCRLLRDGISAQIEGYFVRMWNSIISHFLRFHGDLRITSATFHFLFLPLIIIASPLSGLLGLPEELFGPPARRDKGNPKLNVKSFEMVPGQFLWNINGKFHFVPFRRRVPGTHLNGIHVAGLNFFYYYFLS